ncbi:LysM peptidoglycan-binding domain-containing protein [Rhodococcus phenolicus]|uniref:CIS tube protein n=1 Tax=Rhodococcus phenolicus TaxID=263849 RepID=UPI00082E1B04|nr:LysM peptidoglycan-binding domain-containing protein [Rhodococcus phenolicus]
MTDPIALVNTAAAPPANNSARKKSMPPEAQKHAELFLYKAEKAVGGSKRGSSLGSIKFQFNPKEITISKSAKWDRSPAKGSKKAGPPEYSGPEPCKLTLEMFFDATMKQDTDVVKSVEQLFSCCIPVDEKAPKPMPPLVVLKWGGTTSFNAFVTQVSVKYTLFAPTGKPIRAVCSVSLEEMPGETSRQNPSSGSVTHCRVHEVVDGDSLHLLAYREYGDPAMWRALAAYNGIDDPTRLPPGRSIVLPGVSDLLTRIGSAP